MPEQGHRKKTAGPGGAPLGSSLLREKKWVELCEIQASLGCIERPYLVLLRTHPT